MFFFKNIFNFFIIINIFFYVELIDTSSNLFLFIFLLSFLLNYNLNDLTKNRLNYDLKFKFFLKMLNEKVYFLNYCLNIFNKITLYLIHFKYYYFVNFCKSLLKNYFGNKNLIWRPLFKKTSYFGYFRSMRSKWFK